MLEVKNENNNHTNVNEDDELNIAKLVKDIEVNDELIETILSEHQSFLDFSNLPADLEKAKTHLLASQVYDLGEKNNENIKYYSKRIR